MEPTSNPYAAQAPAPIITQPAQSIPTQIQEPGLTGFPSIVFKILGVLQIMGAIGAIPIPFITGGIVAGMGGGTAGFGAGFKAYAFLAVSAIPAFIFAYGYFKERKWMVSTLTVRLIISAIATTLLSLGILGDVGPSNTTSVLGFLSLNFFGIATLILVIAYRNKLKGKYFEPVPVILTIVTTILVIASAYMNA